MLYFDRTDETTIIEAIKKLENLSFKQELTQKAYLLAKERQIKNYVINMIKIIEEFEVIRECWGQ